MVFIRFVLAIANHLDLEVEQMDIKNAFLNGELKELVYIQQLPSFEIQGNL
ncbi:hypothetical protein SELMODRAFT_98872 [Selaginella moellendorffii]|uniref:Reverse transcriptase Ty1/copia-type domain-containing protein n=1 Tax=Selaginella moellendorffii TaxID=88036 RepID=D8RQR8_SELML|nr:hypothetical protein SELMODRAFT_98872 [Selaginella moellendorffii]